MTLPDRRQEEPSPARETPVLVLLSSGSTWSWRIVDQLGRCGWTPVTVDIDGSSAMTDTPKLDYRIDLPSLMPRTMPLRRIVLAHQINFGLCLYGGRQAYELLLLKHTLRTFCYGIFAAGSDVLRPPEVKPFAWVSLSKKPIAASLTAAAIVLANGTHVTDAVRLATGHRAKVVTWHQGIDTLPERPVRRHSTSGPVAIVAPRPWNTVYNNSYVVEGLLSFNATSADDELDVRFIGPSIASDEVCQLTKLDGKGNGVRVTHQDGYDPAERWALFSRYDLVISMSRSDGTANAVLEAAYTGCIPLLSDIPANRVLVEQIGMRAVLVPLDDPPAFAIGLRNLLARRSEWSAMAAQNRSAIAARLSIRQSQATLCSHLDVFHSAPGLQ